MSYYTNRIFTNTMNYGTWSGWIELENKADSKKPANITQDSTHRFVTDAEKNKWNME